MKTRFSMLAAVFVASLSAVNADSLEEGFKTPPHPARPWVYWDVMNGNFSKEGVTADLESMKDAGLGGVLQMHIGGHVPRGNVEFMSDTWRALFTHAVLECERLGLEFSTITGPGWTGSGGPWIDVEQSMQHLVHAGVNIKGPAKLDQVLPRPPLHFTVSENKHNDRMRKDLDAFYEDVAVYAFPRREPVIGDIAEKALYLRRPYTSMEGVRTHLPSPVSFPESDTSKVIEAEDIVDLTDRLQPDGRLQWDVPAGEWTILRMGRRSTGSNTRPAPEAGLGFESNKMDPSALDTHFETYFDPLIKQIGPRSGERTKGFTGLDADSWEMGAQNWTPGFCEAFRKRRGYDPLPYLPVYSGRVVDSLEISERFLWDVRMTCQDLLLENHIGHMKKLCRARGLKLMIEPYDMTPTNDLDLGSFADIPMGEFWHKGYNSAWSCIEAASIGHIMGKPMVASESFTSSATWWTKSPSMIKDQANWALAIGINRFVIHGFAHQPWLDRAPGMIMGGWGLNWARTQTFWPMVDAFHQYLARCSHLLQQGVTVVDVLYLTPEGAPHVFRAPDSALHDARGRLPDKKGYGFDACSPRMLINRAKVKDGLITFAEGSSYRLMVLPEFETMTPELLEKVTGLVKAGARVVGSPPAKSPSLSGYPACDEKLKTQAKYLWGSLTRPERITRRKFGQGALCWGGEKPGGLYPDYDVTASVLKQTGVSEDFVSTGPVRFTHRSTDRHEIYFVANRSDGAIQPNCTFRVGQGTPQLWDPITGEIRVLPNHTTQNGLTTIPMEFAPHGSFFVIFPREGSTSSADTTKGNFVKTTPAATLEGPWQVGFDPAWGGPEEVTLDELIDWSTSDNEGIQHYSGIATYRKTFEHPGSRIPHPGPLLLSLGTVHEIARVRLNGEELGVVWSAPWRIDISAALKAGTNELQIEVANLWPNRLIGDAGKPKTERLSWTVRHPYKPNSKLLPSGLLGPVQLFTAQKDTSTQ